MTPNVHAPWILAAGLLAISTAPATAQLPPVEVTIGGSYEIISGDQPDWIDTWVRVRQPIPPRSAVYAVGLRSERWGLVDTQLRAGAEFPLGDELRGHVTAAISPTHEFLPRWSTAGDLGVPLGDGWTARVGGGFDRYRADDVTHQFGGLGWRGGDWSTEYRLTATQVTDDSGLWHTASVTRHYSPGSRIGLRGSLGQTILAGPGQVWIDPIQGVGLFGFHQIRPGFGLSYDIGIDDHGTFTRTRLNVGFRVL